MFPLLAICAFALSCLLTVLLMLRRPYLTIRVRRRHVRVQTYFLGAMFGPVAVLLLGVLHLPEVIANLRGTPQLNPAGILALFLSMAFLSIFLDITGFFEACARLALRHSGQSARRLFAILYATVSVLTVFTSNDIIILTFTPIICHFARGARVNPVPYLVAEFFAANTWSAFLYVGNPTNILVASAFQIDFLHYARLMAFPTAVAGALNFLLLRRLFRRALAEPLRPVAVESPAAALTDRLGAALSTLLLGACIAGLAVAPRLHVPMWKVSVGAAFALLAVLVVRRSRARALRQDLDLVGGPGMRRTLGRMPWTIIPFVLSMFTMVEALRRTGVLAGAGRLLAGLVGHSAPLAALVYGGASAVAANILNNIPMTLAFAGLLNEAPEGVRLAGSMATAFGSNLGANLTPFGALAGLLWLSMLREKEIDLSFGRFIRYGLAVTPVSLLAGLLALALQFL